jgi:hypothetical protein
MRATSYDPQGQPASPEATAVTDERGAYTLSFPTWPGGGPLSVNLELPPGFVFVAMTNSGFNPGGLQTQRMFSTDVAGDGPIDITLALGHVVEGRVTSGLTGAPLAGIQLLALNLNSILIYGIDGDAFEIEDDAMTDATGRYSLTVPSGSYVIYATDQIYANEQAPGAQQRFWSEDPTIFQASHLNVDRGVAGIDIELVPVTVISGEFQSCGAPIVGGPAGVRVVAYLAGGTPCCRTVGTATTDDNGTFLMFVPAGTYRIAFQPAAGSPYAAQWWKGATGFENATDVTAASASVHLVVELGAPSP